MTTLRLIGKAAVVSLLCLILVAIVAPLFGTSLLELLREYKGWTISAFVVLPVVYVIIRDSIRKGLKDDKEA